MSLIFNFNIEELPDGKSFIFTDLTGDYADPTNLGGWGLPNSEETDVATFDIIFTKLIQLEVDTEVYTTLSLKVSDYPVINWKTGVEIPFLDTKPILPDGSYEVRVKLYNVSGTPIAETPINYCFFALIKDATMKELLGYNQFLPKRTKELYWEKGRILDNLYYATQTNQVLHFDENLAQLVKLG